MLVVALGLVLMHHVVGAHQHSLAGGPMPETVRTEAATAPPGIVDHGSVHGGGAVASGTAAPAGAVIPGPAALLHHHSGDDGHDHVGSLLHLCLAALLGAAVLLVLVVAATGWRHEGPRFVARLAVAATAPRAPPTASRLAALQVLRL